MSIDHALSQSQREADNTLKKQKQSSSVVYATSRQSSSAGRWFRQLGVVCRLNVLLLMRYWKAAILQVIILPILSVVIVYAIQKSSTSENGKVTLGSNAVSTWKMEGIPQCKPEPLSNACMTIVYTPFNDETTQIMNYFQNQNQIRTNQALKMETTVWDNLGSVPKSDMGIVPVPSEQFIYDYALAHPDTIQLGVAFTKQEPVAPATGPVHWNYQIYYNMTHATNISVVPGFKYTKEAGYNRATGFDDPYGAQLPNMIRAMDEALLTYLDPQHTQAQLDYSLKSFPTTDRVNSYSSEDDIVNAVSNLWTLPACITMIMAMLRVTREKESKCRESMEMMGLSSFAYWTAQWLTSWIMPIIQSSIVVGLGYAFKMQIFTNSNGVVMWLMFVLLAYAMTLLGLLLTTFCRKTGTALGFGFALLVAVLITVPILATGAWPELWINTASHFDPVTMKVYPPERRYTWVICFLFPFLSFARLWSQISTVALGSVNYTTGAYTPGPGFNFTNLTYIAPLSESWEGYVPQPDSALYYQLIAIVVIALLTLYFDKVIPDDHGRSSSVFFFLGGIRDVFRFIRYGGSAGVARARSADAQRVIPYEGQPPANEDSDVIAERERAVNCQSEVAIRISNLTKTYTKNGPGFFKNLYLALCCCCCRTRRRSNKITNHAVDRMNLLTEPNELFALLGQNGAGKSTTMQMLYGVTTPTSGNAFLFNRSIKTDMHTIRSTMGVCPQHDVLFNDLTCWEHMQLYGGIKDLPAEALRASFDDDADNTETVKENTHVRYTWIRSRLEAVQLWKDRDTMAGRLSGGMKRRLSTIISTIGDPNVLILDEPTTGMDPVHRRHVWTFLAQFKRGRSILLTTHSMEEADALGDKVAIMVSGHLKAIGNTTRLKNKFGNGYRVEIALGQPTEQFPNIPEQKVLEEEMTTATRQIMPESVLLDNSGGVMVFGIPMQAIEKMANLTSMLERAQSQGRIKQWGIAQTSLEEVFLSLIRSSDDRH